MSHFLICMFINNTILKQQRDEDLVSVLVLRITSYPWISVFNTAAVSLKQEYISFITDNSFVKLSGDKLDKKMKSSRGSASLVGNTICFVLMITTWMGNDRSDSEGVCSRSPSALLSPLFFQCRTWHVSGVTLVKCFLFCFVFSFPAMWHFMCIYCVLPIHIRYSPVYV